jgi:hypothetical protein
MNDPFGGYPFTVSFAPYIPTAPAPWTAIVLPQGSGYYTLLPSSIVRTAGVLAASISPQIATAIPTNGLDIVVESNALTLSLALVNFAQWYSLDPLGRFFVPTDTIFVAVRPNVLGDTFTGNVRLARID